ncbi:MAG: nickel insertion protein, partial [Thermoplasmata archaeon]
TGLGISYLGLEPARHGISYEECFARLARIEGDLGSRSATGRAILEMIFAAEEKAHGVPKREVHLHEIGRPQGLLNMAGIGLVSSKLLEADADGFVCTTITTGSGTMVTSHGPTRIPAPAAAVLLEGLRHAPGPVPGERATPTGIAAAKVLIAYQSDDLPLRFLRRSVGFGTRRFAGRLGRTTVARA